MTNLKTVASTVAILCFAAASFASEEVQTKMRIDVVDDRSHGDIMIELDSDELGFNLHDMQVGENRSIIDKSGQSILITRQENGFVLDVDGKQIEMPVFDGAHHEAVWVGGDNVKDVEVHVMKDMNFSMAGSADGIMIMSGKPIDEATQQAIKSLLESTGHGSEVNFINHELHLDEDRGDGEHQVKVIRKKIEIKE